jgi:hypothetical protein
MIGLVSAGEFSERFLAFAKTEGAITAPAPLRSDLFKNVRRSNGLFFINIFLFKSVEKV